MLNPDAEDRLLAALCRLGTRDAGDSRAGRVRACWIVALLSYTAVLVGHIISGTGALRAPISFWDMQDTALLLDWLRSLATSGMIRFVEFLLLGLVVSLTVGYWRRGASVGFGALLCSAAMGVGLGAGILFLAGRVLDPIGSALPAAGCLAGVWSGWSWARSRAARRWLIPQFVVVLALTAGIVYRAESLALEPAPFAFQPAKVTSAEKRRLVQLLRSAANQEDTRRVRLSQHDVDLLLAWALPLGSQGRKASVRLGANHADVLASLALPNGQYVNLQAEVRVRVDAGQLEFALLRLRLGRLQPPDWLLNLVSDQVIEVIGADPEFGSAIKSIESLSIHPDAVEVAARPQAAGRGLRSLLARLGPPQDTSAGTRIYVEHLLAVAEGFPEGDARFAGLLRAAFELARRRSQDGDAVQENRVAIYALGIVLGHPRLEWLIGSVLDDRLRQALPRRTGNVTIRGRADWVRHYCVSAALALWSSEIASDAAGLLKEELDAGRGGSGFSFSDLLADRAGTRFALAATKDPETAHKIQQLLAGDWELDAVFPPAADLPEGLSDQELQSQFGGVGGENYKRMIEEIEKRLGRTMGSGGR